MTDQQWTVVVLLVVLFSLEAIRVPAIYNWLVGAINQISAAISGNTGTASTSGGYTPAQKAKGYGLPPDKAAKKLPSPVPGVKSPIWVPPGT